MPFAFFVLSLLISIPAYGFLLGSVISIALLVLLVEAI